MDVNLSWCHDWVQYTHWWILLCNPRADVLIVIYTYTSFYTSLTSLILTSSHKHSICSLDCMWSFNKSKHLHQITHWLIWLSLNRKNGWKDEAKQGCGELSTKNSNIFQFSGKRSLGEMHKHSCDELSRPVNVSSALYNSNKKINYLHHEKHM